MWHVNVTTDWTKIGDLPELCKVIKINPNGGGIPIPGSLTKGKSAEDERDEIVDINFLPEESRNLLNQTSSEVDRL